MRQRSLPVLTLLIVHVIVCCASLVYVAELRADLQVVMFDRTRLLAAVLNVVPFAAAAILLAWSRFSFGYVLGFYSYTIIIGYLWLITFSRLNYNHGLATVSAYASGFAFLLPALYEASPSRQRMTLSESAYERLLTAILLGSALVVAIGSAYNFRWVSVSHIYDFRATLNFPAWLRYAVGIMSGALLPFAFAGFIALRRYARAVVILLLMLLLYPITLSKLVLLAPAWLLFQLLLARRFEPRICVILSLLLPGLAGVGLAALVTSNLVPSEIFKAYFDTINLRMVAIPSAALDVYNDYFSAHPATHFCQISILNRFVDCPYQDPLSIVMERAYHLGNFNASLFATEGIASVGTLMAPFAAAVGGLVIALGNRASCGLPPTFVLLSSGILPQFFLNVPLTTMLVTHGGIVLFFLWYVTPRKIFDHDRRLSLNPSGGAA